MDCQNIRKSFSDPQKAGEVAEHLKTCPYCPQDFDLALYLAKEKNQHLPETCLREYHQHIQSISFQGTATQSPMVVGEHAQVTVQYGSPVPAQELPSITVNAGGVGIALRGRLFGLLFLLGILLLSLWLFWPNSGEGSLTPPQFTIFRRRSGSAPWQEAVFLLSGDHYQIRLKVFQQSYIYGFQRDETGSIYQLFPDANSWIPDPEKNRYAFPLPVGAKDYVIAPQNGYFPLDRAPGFEEFCFLYTSSALSHPEQSLRDYVEGRPLDPKIGIVVKRLEQRDISPDQNH